MLKKGGVIFLALITIYGCKSAPTPVPEVKTVEIKKFKLEGCAKYLEPASTFRGGCAEGDCTNGEGVFVYDNGDCYEGDNKNNIRHGDGIMYYKNWGEKYSGNWVNDNRVGYGTLTFNNGDFYTGEFKLNVPWGLGVYVYADGSKEQGEFFDYLFVNVIKLPGLTDQDKVEIGRVTDVNQNAGEVTVSAKDIKSGSKLFVEINGLMAAMEVLSSNPDSARCRMIGGTRALVGKVYRGMTVFTIMPGIKRGNNTFLFPNGNRYIGEYTGNLMHGKGEFHWTNGNIYRGEFKNGMRHGNGVLTFYNGSSYTGDWRDGYMEGDGIYTWSNGNKYTGSFSRGYREGKATFIWGNGDRFKGTYKKDKMDGYGEFTSATGETYLGDYRDDMKDGKGTYTWKSGDRYIGEWKKNMQDGEGTYIWNDGGKYIGQWKEHKMHGKGAEYNSDGALVRKGMWDMGKYTGEGI